MKYCFTFLAVLFFALSAMAQSKSRNEALLEYRARQNQAKVEFVQNYRKAYADYMRKRWESFNPQAPLPIPERREPEQPITKQPDAPQAPTEDKISYDKVVTLPETAPEIPLPQPLPPDKPQQPVKPSQPATPQKPTQSDKPLIVKAFPFTFYGTDCSVSLTAGQKFRLASLQENSVADMWAKISGGSYDNVYKECADLKKALNLNDWGYYELVRTISDAFCGAKSSESALLQSFLMAEAGYKVRLAKSGNNLYLLLAVNDKVYDSPYFQIGGANFYLLSRQSGGGAFSICNFAIPGERVLSLMMPSPPSLTQKTAPTATRKYGDLSTSVAVNANLMDFYTNYPACWWSIYAATPLTSSVKEQLYPTLRNAIVGKSEYESANLLLHYLHKAFAYKTDEEQFGVERTFFAEEMFYYPYSDCEDRSILFARLVKDLLNLDVVLLYYPNHIATAVCFKDSVKGDYISLNSKRYTICDPTYIGSNVGEAMPETKRQSAEVIQL